MMHRNLLEAGLLSAQAAASRMACDADLLPPPEEESFVMCSSTQLGLAHAAVEGCHKVLVKPQVFGGWQPCSSNTATDASALDSPQGHCACFYLAGGLTIF